MTERHFPKGLRVVQSAYSNNRGGFFYTDIQMANRKGLAILEQTKVNGIPRVILATPSNVRRIRYIQGKS